MMKKATIFSLILLLAHTSIHAQTAIYKAYVDKPNINASCISNYPIGDNTTVTVTMLQAADSATFKALMKSLLTLPYTNDKSGKRNKSSKEFKEHLEHLSSNSGDISEPSIKKALGHITKMDMTVTMTAPSSSNKCSFTSFRSDPLPGDNGLYEIFHSSGTRTILVFHCPDNEVAAQVTNHFIENIAQSLKSR